MAEDTTEPFLSMREAVMEIRRDVKELAQTSVTRTEFLVVVEDVRQLQNTGFRFAGTKAAVLMATSALAGFAGLILASLTVAHYYFT